MREYVELDEMTVKWIGTKVMWANGFTKVLPGMHLLIPWKSYNLGKFLPCGGVL